MEGDPIFALAAIALSACAASSAAMAATLPYMDCIPFARPSPIMTPELYAPALAPAKAFTIPEDIACIVLSTLELPLDTEDARELMALFMEDCIADPELFAADDIAFMEDVKADLAAFIPLVTEDRIPVIAPSMEDFI